MEAGTVVGCRRGEREGNGTVVLDIWKWREDVHWEAFRCAGYVRCTTVLMFSPLLLLHLLYLICGESVAANSLAVGSYRNEINNSGHLYEFLDADY